MNDHDHDHDHDHHVTTRYDELKLTFHDLGLTLNQSTTEEVERRVVSCEQTYGIASENLHAAIDDGRITETLEVCDWLIDHDRLTRARKGATHD